MASDNEVLYLVTKKTLTYGRRIAGTPLLFRTRKAARDCARDKNKKSKKFRYTVVRAKWGPEQ